MPRVRNLELMAVDLPLRHAFRHAAAVRTDSESLFLKCTTAEGVVGYGESLPRAYVTGETRDAAFTLLKERVLPRLVGMRFDSFAEVWRFLAETDGKAPADWVNPVGAQSAAWCAVDLALLDTFGRAFGEPITIPGTAGIQAFDNRRYSAVVSAGRGWSFLRALLRLRLYGFREVKLKTGPGDVGRSGAVARRVMGKSCALRIDANMSWEYGPALEHIRALKRSDIRWVEQPLPADNLHDASKLIRETGCDIIADESFSDRASLQKLVTARACTGVNVRISKCGGLVAAVARCREALQAGLQVQIGCQVGESSLLSAAQLRLISAVPEARFLEGCYGKHLLRSDPGEPVLQLGYGGRRPRLPEGPGLGVRIIEAELARWVRQRAEIGEHTRSRSKGGMANVVCR